jgi:hypothetical protein
MTFFPLDRRAPARGRPDHHAGDARRRRPCDCVRPRSSVRPRRCPAQAGAVRPADLHAIGSRQRTPRLDRRGQLAGRPQGSPIAATELKRLRRQGDVREYAGMRMIFQPFNKGAYRTRMGDQPIGGLTVAGPDLRRRLAPDERRLQDREGRAGLRSRRRAGQEHHGGLGRGPRAWPPASPHRRGTPAAVQGSARAPQVTGIPRAHASGPSLRRDEEVWSCSDRC